jgi:type IV fimbrial biogenesis protein FimT
MKTCATNCRRDAAPQNGFSIVELMVTLVVLGIIAAAASPGFMSIVNNNRLASSGNELNATLQNARMEATRRGIRVVVCPSNDGANCTTGARWRGWISFEDKDGDAVLDGGESILRSHVLAEPLELWSSTNVSADSRIVFRHDGFAYNKDRSQLMAANLRACIRTSHPPQNARDVSLAAGGRVAITPIDAGGDCAAPGNP